MPSTLATGVSFAALLAAGACARGNLGALRSRTQRRGFFSSFVKRIKEPFRKIRDRLQKKQQDKIAGDPLGQFEKLLTADMQPDVPSDKCIVIASASPQMQPFCGEYMEQPEVVNERKVFKKVLEVGGTAIYLLYNNAKQWAISPNIDGSADGWAFASDPAMDPADIQGTFQFWSGTAWVPDATIKVYGPDSTTGIFEALAAPEKADTKASVETEVVDEVLGAPVLDVQEYPQQVEPLSYLHWKAQLYHNQRVSVEWPALSASVDLASRKLPEHPDVRRGVLSNGLRYVLLRNSMPPKRFEAHIEIHVGSIDEEEHEQGIAHMMEHVCFLGSRKREGLLGTGTRSNALTDFQHTIYHVHSPVAREDGTSMYIPVLEALHEITFAPQMLANRIEKERKAVLAEMQQVNDMEYRLETWTLSQLHENNNLGCQFPIGKEELIKGWQRRDLKAFYEKWYYPGNCTLFVVGDLSEEEMVEGIEKVFKSTPARHAPKPGVGYIEPTWGSGSYDERSLYRRKIARARQEILHNMNAPMIGTKDEFTEAACFDRSKGEGPWHGPLKIFRNELVEGVQLNFYGKAPVRPLRTLEDILYLVQVRILIALIQFRIVSRFTSNQAPVTIDHSDSFREGCAVTAITITANPVDWRSSLLYVIQEMRALCDYGITEAELKRYQDAMLKDLEKGVLEAESVPSEDHLNFIMTSDIFDHVVMHPEQSYEAFKEVMPYVTREGVQQTAKWCLGFLAYYGMSMAPPPTAMVIATPTKYFDEAKQEYVDFDITEDEVVELLTAVADKSEEEALNQLEPPESLITNQLDAWLASNPIDKFTAWRTMSRKHDEKTGITQMVLPNGAKVNYACTLNESQGTLKIVVPGGNELDTRTDPGAASVGVRTITESGAVSNFQREQIELFAVTNLLSATLDISMEYANVNCTFQTGGEYGYLELLHLLFTEPRWEVPAFVRAQQVYKGQAMAYKKSLEQSTMDRLMKMMFPKDQRFTQYSSEAINNLTLKKVREAYYGQVRPQDMEINLVADFEGLKSHKALADVEGALSTGKHREEGEHEEVELVKQVSDSVREERLRDLDEALWKYLGSIPPSEDPRRDVTWEMCIQDTKALTKEEKEVVAHLEDSDERAIANLGGGAPNRWGKGDAVHTAAMKEKNFSWKSTDSKYKDHKLYPVVCQLALREVMNTRLFSMVRDKMGLSYDCKFHLSMLDRVEVGWYSCTVSAHPSQIDKAVEAAKRVLSSVKKNPITVLELSSAKATLKRRHETDLQTNEYWINLMEQLQLDSNAKDLSCVSDLVEVINGIEMLDVNNAYRCLLTDEDQVFVSICTAGPGASWVSGGAVSVPASSASASGTSSAASDTEDAPKELLFVD